MSGEVTGTEPGDTVKVWFEGGGERSDSFTYEVESDTGNSVLILAAEDYTGASPAEPAGSERAGLPVLLPGRAERRTASTFDVYDVDAHGRTAPDDLGVLSHYDAVVWYTGDDLVTRKPGWGPGNVSRLAMQELYEVRDYINQGGRVLYAGQAAGQQYTSSLGLQLYDPFETGSAAPTRPWRRAAWPPRGPATRRATRSSTSFGAAITTADGGSDPETCEPFEVAGIDDPLDGPDRAGSTAPTAPRTT